MTNPPTSARPGVERTWLVAGVIMAVAFWIVIIISAREMALANTSLRAYFVIQGGTVDRDIDIVANHRFLGLFNLYSVLLLGFIPIALQRIFRNAVLGMAAVALLFLPCLWYGNRVLHIAGKMVDFGALMRGDVVR